MSARQRIDRSRRNVIKTGLAGFVAAGASGLRIAEAQTPSRASNGPLFFDVETTSGVVRGMANTGIKIFRGIPYGADTGGQEPLHAAAQAGGVDRRAQLHRLRADLAADAVGLPIRLLADDPVGPPRRHRRHERGLPVAQRLDARRQRQREARRAGLVSRRRLGDRLRQRTDVRRRPTRAARRRRRRHGQSSARELRLHASGRGRRAGRVQASPASAA